jgi:hypothetical protein
VKKMDKVYGTDADKSELIKLEFLMDPNNPESDFKYSRQFAIKPKLDPERSCWPFFFLLKKLMHSIGN